MSSSHIITARAVSQINLLNGKRTVILISSLRKNPGKWHWFSQCYKGFHHLQEGVGDNHPAWMKGFRGTGSCFESHIITFDSLYMPLVIIWTTASRSKYGSWQLLSKRWKIQDKLFVLTRKCIMGELIMKCWIDLNGPRLYYRNHWNPSSCGTQPVLDSEQWRAWISPLGSEAENKSLKSWGLETLKHICSCKNTITT